MLSENNRALLERHVEMKGRKQVTAELDISSTTLSLVLGDKYGASTAAIERKLMNIYGADGKVNCPQLGRIDPAQCASHFGRAQKIISAGNPATIRLYIACRKCDFRR